MRNQIDEIGYSVQSRIRDTDEITSNSELIERQMLSLLGLDVNRDGELVVKKIVISGKEHRAKQVMSYEGVIRFLDLFLRPFLSNLGSFTNLNENRIATLSERFTKDLVTWLTAHRIEYEIDRRDIGPISMQAGRVVYMQLNRSKDGEMVTQVMGNMQKQYVYRGDLEAQQQDPYSQGQSRPWYNRFFGGGQ